MRLYQTKLFPCNFFASRSNSSPYTDRPGSRILPVRPARLALSHSDASTIIISLSCRLPQPCILVTVTQYTPRVPWTTNTFRARRSAPPSSFCRAMHCFPALECKRVSYSRVSLAHFPASHLPRTVRYEPRAQPANLNLSCQPGTAPLSPTRDGLAVRSAKVEWSGVGACKPFIITHRQTPILHTGYVHHANSIRAAMFSILPGNCTWRIAHADIGPCCA
jgi:hypothetical protein